MNKKSRSLSGRDRWLDPKHTKSKVSRECQAHPFCNIEYEWLDDSSNLKERNSPLVAGMLNIVLPESQDPPDRKITYAGMTEEGLDDWIAQSINRNIVSMLNPQKKYNLPSGFEEELRVRYKGLKQSFNKNSMDEDLYFPPTSKRKTDNHLLYKSRKKDLNLQELVIPGQKLCPQEDSKGTPIRIRQQKKFAKKVEPRRRGGVYLNDDYFYKKFIKEHVEDSGKTNQPESQKSIRKAASQNNDTSIFSYNMQNVFRKSIVQPVPSSLIETELTRIGRAVPSDPGIQNQMIEKYNKLQEEYKDKLNNTASRFIKEMSPSNQISKVETPIIETKKKGKQSNLMPPMINLGEKVKQLLNDTHIHSENLDQELLSFRVHCDEIRIDKFQNKPHIKWMIKAQENIREKTYQLAVDCYKQSLIVQPESFVAVFNVGSLMEKQNSLAQAKKWFELAMEFGQEKQKVSFGLAIVCFKKSEFKESLKYIDGIIKECGDNVPPIYYYVRALNQKRLGMMDQAKNDYKLIQGNVVPENYNILANLMFSLVFARMRRMEIRFNCLSYMQFRNTLDYILYETGKLVIEDKQIFEDPKEYDSLAIQLSKLNFFKRFPISIIKRLFPVLRYFRITKNTIMLPEQGHTAVILSGAVAMKNHQRNFQRPELTGLLSEGDIIGAGKLDNFVSEKPNMWCHCESDVEYVLLKQPDFNSFWKAQFTLDLDRNFAFLKNVQLFKDLSEISLLRLCEMFELKTYNNNAILFNDCSYRSRPANKIGKGFGLHPKGGQDWGALKFKSSGELMGIKRTSSRLYAMISKHRGRINGLKFKNLRYPGLFVLVQGTLEIEDDCGFRTTNFISKGDYFGENLIFQSEGYQRYGRMVVNSDNAELYFLSLKNISRLILFEVDISVKQREQMKKSTLVRKDIETLAFIHKRYREVLKVKINTREEVRRIREGV